MKNTIATVQWLMGNRAMSNFMANAGLGLSGVGVKETVKITFAAGELVDEARVLRAISSMQEASDKEKTSWVIMCPKVISIESN